MEKIKVDHRPLGSNALAFQLKKCSDSLLIEFYKGLILSRLIEEKMLLLLRQGKIAKWFAGIGQEALSIGSVFALEEDEYICTLHRNLGIFTNRGVPLKKLFAQLMGKKTGFTKGRDRSFHFGSPEHHLVGMISHLGAQLGVAAGVALGERLSGRQKAALVFTGDGGTSEGDFHEALNLASVWELPVIFLIENNGYAFSTPTEEQYRCEKLSDRALGYGMEGRTIDGNNVLEVYNTISHYAREIREKPRPILIEAITFRMRGHEETSGSKYIPSKLFEHWEKRDPVIQFQRALIEEEILADEQVEEIKEKFQRAIDLAWEEGEKEPEANSSPEEELREVYAPSLWKERTPSGKKEELRFIDALSQGLDQALSADSRVILMGQDIAEYGGVFKVTQGLVEKYGRERIRNTPLCESAVIGAALGLSIQGYKPVVEMQFADFVSCGFNQIVNNLAKVHYRWGQKADVVIRMPTGAGVGAGPFHSQSNEGWFFHTPGLKIVFPAFPGDAKGLLLSSIEDPNPVLFFEHKALYRTLSEEVFSSPYTLPLGKARVVRPGEEITLITYGMGVHWALEVMDRHPEISVELLDLRTLLPWDREGVAVSLKKTGKALLLHEDTLTGGIGAEIGAFLSEELFEHLDGPVVRVASLDTPVPMAASLERQFLGKARLEDRLLWLWGY